MADTSFVDSLFAFAVFVSFVLFVLILILVRRRMKKNWVWTEIDTRDGKTWRKLRKPNADKTVTIGKGRYDLLPDASTNHNAGWPISDMKPMWRYVEGVKWPVVLRPEKYVGKKEVDILSLNPGGHYVAAAGVPFEVPMARYMTIPAEAEEVFMKQHLFSQAYGAGLGLLALLLAGFALLIVIVIGTYLPR